MQMKRLIAVFLTAVIFMGVFSYSLCSYAILMCETQFTYDSANLSWLKDLIVKEDMSSINDLSIGQCTLQPVSDYPYNETAESFSEEVAYYQILYSLDEDMANVAYLYILELTESLAGSAAASSYSDEFIRSYLESLGVVYPTGDAADSSETLIVARAFFAIISNDENYVVNRGTGLYEAFTAYISTLLGVNMSSIIKFDSDSSLSDLKEYVIAACKYLLYNAGYNVNSETTDEEVYRLIAVMTIKAQGISIDSSASLEEIKIKYLCAMMCKIYDVSINVADFEDAVDEGRLDFYMLQLLGKENGVTVKNSVTYEEAFDIVCKNTHYFDLEAGEFYADVYEYNVQLDYKRDKIWLYPQTLGTTSESEGTAVDIKINGTDVRENYYVDVALDSSKENETILITVEYKDKSGSKSSTYAINIYQGTETYVSSNTISNALSGVTDIVTDLLAEVGLDSSIANIVRNIPFELPERIFSIASLLLPSFDTGSMGSSFLQALFGYSENDDSNVDTDQLGGVGGLDTFNSSGNSTQSMDFTGRVDNITNIQINTPGLNSGIEKPTNSANELIIQDNQQANNQLNISDDGNWLSDLMSDTSTVIILIVVLVLTFAVCFILFLNILKARSENGGKQKKNKDKN